MLHQHLEDRELAGGERHFFFFSSRRRHTRLTCDWSSDACSSDLVELSSRIRPDILDRAGEQHRPRRAQRDQGVLIEGQLFGRRAERFEVSAEPVREGLVDQDRKSTRLNSSHMSISYAVFCLKKKK